MKYFIKCICSLSAEPTAQHQRDFYVEYWNIAVCIRYLEHSKDVTVCPRIFCSDIMFCVLHIVLHCQNNVRCLCDIITEP